MKMKMAVLVLGIIAGSFTIQDAGANGVAGPSATVMLDWNTFEIRSFDLTGIATAPSWTWSNQEDSSDAWAGGLPVFDSANNWSDGTLAEAWGSYAMGMTSNAQVSSFTSLDLNEAGEVSSWALRSGDLTISGAGLLVAMVNYSWQVDIAGSQPGDQSASASCSISLWDENRTQYGNGYASGTLPFLSEVFRQYSGTIVAALNVTDGMIVHMEADTSTNVSANPVPVPPALWLLASGVFALLAGKRGKSRS